jgi:hypothetical protein
MKNWEKILIIIGGLVMFAMMGLMLVKIYNLETQQQALQTQVVKSAQLADGISRAMATYATKQEIQAFADQNSINLKTIQDNLNTLSASLTSINQSTVVSNGQNQGNVASTSSTPNKKPTPAKADPYGYDKSRQVLQVSETFTAPNTNKPVSVPFGEVGCSAWQQKPWDVKIPPREYNSTTVIGTDANDRQYAYNAMSIKTGGKEYPVEIKSNVIMQQPTSNTFSWWSPHLFLTAGGAVDLDKLGGDANIGATLGIMSYGKTKQTSILSIGQVGLGYQIADQRPTLIVNPIMFNVGRMISPNNGVISNTYVGPSVQGDIDGGKAVVKAGINIAVGL